jgi:hypothetical protein
VFPFSLIEFEDELGGGTMPRINWFEMSTVRPIVGKAVLFKGPAADDATGEALMYMSGSYHPVLDSENRVPWVDSLCRPITEFCPTHWTYLDSLEQ